MITFQIKGACHKPQTKKNGAQTLIRDTPLCRYGMKMENHKIPRVIAHFNLFFLITVLLVTMGMGAFAENPLRVEYFPSVAKQGDVIFIKASGPFRSVYGTFQRERFPMDSGERDGIYEGLLGIDMNARPATYEIKIAATDVNRKVYSNPLLLKVEKVDFGTEKLSLPPSMVNLDLKNLERVNQEARQLKALFQGFRDERVWRGPFIPPVSGEIISAFGLRRIMNGQPRSSHTGVDLQGEEGTPVLACNRGVVVLVDELFFSGKSIILDHGWGIYSMVFHLSETLVRKGDSVSTGAMIGRVGSTGRSTEPHLHWGIKIRGARVDPLSLLRLTEHLQKGSR